MTASKTTVVSQSACKVIYKDIWGQWGNGWKLLGDDLKRAVIAQRILFLFTGLDEETPITASKIHAYYLAMVNYCGLEKDS